jgi:SH3-like domain-containing protein
LTGTPRKIRPFLLFLILTSFLSAAASQTVPAFAQQDQIKTSGLPLPRFVSLKSARVNMRVGPGRDYMVDWMYMRRGLPVEVIQEYDTWRKVRDSEGNEGWVLHSLLSGERMAIVAPWQEGGEMIELRDEPLANARVVAHLEPGVIAPVHACQAGWCELDVAGAHGFVSQKQVWGVYPDETFGD